MIKSASDIIVPATVVAIDPGTTSSGWLCWREGDPDFRDEIIYGTTDNWLLRSMLTNRMMEGDDGRSIAIERETTRLLVEWVSSHGRPVGRSTYETVFWVGMFVGTDYPYQKVPFSQPWGPGSDQYSGGDDSWYQGVAMHLVGRNHAKDVELKSVLRPRFPQTGGGATPAVGTKAQPGPLYGIRGDHQWSALAVAVTFKEQFGKERTR